MIIDDDIHLPFNKSVAIYMFNAATRDCHGLGAYLIYPTKSGRHDLKNS
jgi:hypothetical protein